jgi:hypothetical protein
MLGLPQMAHFFLQSNRLQPGSSLLKHIGSHRLADFEAPTTDSKGRRRGQGYDQSVLVRQCQQSCHQAVISSFLDAT